MRRKLTKLPYRRKFEGKTDYKRRLLILKSKKPMLVIRKTNKYIIAQIIVFDKKGDRVLFSANSKELSKYGWNLSFKSIPAAYLTGLLLGKKASKEVKEAILYLGLQEKGNRLFAALKGVVDAGLNIPHNPEVFPSDDLISGKHIQEYLKQNYQEHNKNQFLKYKGVNVEELFNKVRDKIKSE